ncbi:PEP-CTERM sorting domain-containing protein [Cerasicoccus arenae]|uniref:PEP-CTERM protein-sorting domain-containing protein n=1 Tax=Cerasicoccus arenae TaxID=424488 RepID=A0A8J3DE82_9BACT|nr:PEP-CTERM sorting domain-containing protein [Cerasicoccus arenae]MBK1858877.1 PEP-CTERM sorting domain-containing protein [Cerasicoccus arenae]GHB96210.1 hypothetical protein GCM10007047_09970 [Cerasicoccus arenae]
MMYPKSILLSCALLANSSFGVVLFSDSFENPPDVVGEAPVGWNVSNAVRIFVTDARASVGTQSLFLSNSSLRTVTSGTPIAIPGGGEDLVFSFDYAIADSIESNEGLIGFALDFGSGFEDVIIDLGQSNGYANVSNYSGSTIVLPNAAGGDTAFFSYEVTVPASYYGAATDVSMRFRTNSSAGGEDFYLDNVSVSAIAIPEPATYAMLMSIGVLMLVGYCRRK